MFRILLSPVPLGMVVGSAPAEERTFQSGPQPVALIELYTSEGCSSCPPAERWLAQRAASEGLWTQFVPVAFHVNYWDHLGWRDALASPAFTARERAYATAWNAASVYTPCFVRDGVEWRPSADGEVMPRAEPGHRPDSGVLRLRWHSNDSTCDISYRPAAQLPPPALDVVVARLGGGIVTAVRRGENAGRELRHEFVALRLETAALARGADGNWSARVMLPPRSDIAAPSAALAGWVVPHGRMTPLQAAGGWLVAPMSPASAQNMSR